MLLPTKASAKECRDNTDTTIWHAQRLLLLVENLYSVDGLIKYDDKRT
jgi:hypothetical protein